MKPTFPKTDAPVVKTEPEPSIVREPQKANTPSVRDENCIYRFADGTLDLFASTTSLEVLEADGWFIESNGFHTWLQKGRRCDPGRQTADIPPWVKQLFRQYEKDGRQAIQEQLRGLLGLEKEDEEDEEDGQ